MPDDPNTISMTMIWSFVVDGTYTVTRPEPLGMGLPKPLVRVNPDWLTVYFSAVLILTAAIPALLYERTSLGSPQTRWAEGGPGAVENGHTSIRPFHRRPPIGNPI